MNADDRNGRVVTKDVTVTITGTNDTPVIGVAQLTGAVTEDAQGNESGSEIASGTIAFSDVDLSDVHVASAALIYTLSLHDALPIFAVAKSADTTGSGNGGLLTWTFTATDGA